MERSPVRQRARASGVALLAVVAAACAPSRAVPMQAGEGTGPVLRVPHAPAPIALDGDNDDPGWTRSPGPARTGPFALAGAATAARPYADARLLWGDGYLYVLLYAADDDIRSRGDTFRMRLSRFGVEYAIEVSPDGTVRDAALDARGAVDPAWRSGAHASREIDGTLDDPRDTDEEWSVELAVPLASLGMRGQAGESASFAIERCDASTSRGRVCSHWGDRAAEGGRLVIE
jgi:hypothetical protein